MNTEIFTKRRSVNFFDTNKNLDEKTFKEIMDLAALAPSSFNLQPWRVIAIRSNDEKERLLPLAWNQEKVKEASYTLIIVGDRSGFEGNKPIWNEIEKETGEDTVEMLKGMASQLYGATKEKRIKFAETNGSLFAMSIMYAAKSLGVDSHAMSGVDYEGIKKEYGLAESEEVVLLVTLGYHDQSKELYPRSYRKKADKLYEII